MLETLATLAKDGATSAELGVHPGEGKDPDRGRYDWNYRWGDELAALTDPRAKEAVKRLGFELATFDAV